MYFSIISEKLDSKLAKLVKKNKKQYEIVMKKAGEVLSNPYHYKNLRAPMQKFKRVHIDRHFVLIFSVNENEKEVVFEDLDHHDKIYLR